MTRCCPFSLPLFVMEVPISQGWASRDELLNSKMHRPRAATTMLTVPNQMNNAAMVRIHRDCLLRMRIREIIQPSIRHEIANVRRAKTRGWFPLHIDHRMKLGCDWFRRVTVVNSNILAKALGWVVFDRAVSRYDRSRYDMFSSLGAPGTI